MADRVLVSGGTGFLGKRTVLELLDRGYDVRTTVRDLASEDTIRTDLAAAGIAPGNRLEVVAANLTSDDGWPEAAADCRFVLHIASPFPPEQPKDPDELIVPAREGAKRALAAALDAGAERVVLTSSVAAIHANRQDSEAQPLNEDDWTDGDDTSRIPYTRSKTLAERAAWALAEEKGARERLATVNPGAIIGPVLGEERSYSLQTIERLLEGDMPAIPKLGFSFVDVRDVADLHIRAMTDPEASGERFLAISGDFMSLAWMADVLRARLGGDDASKVPSREAPTC
ncbi:MAG: NAD-dependent epimerase/dehydratase family protein [Solirubrobacterales bacterium]|nr:NAD-dependent epimerase/dehydratase family protein [Solirubrobacterales bacterium]